MYVPNTNQSVLAPPNNNKVVFLIPNLYFSTKMVFKNTKVYFWQFVFLSDYTKVYFRVIK
jgi:hypothetical protein